MFTLFAGDGDKIIPNPSTAQWTIILVLLLIFASVPPLISTFIYKKSVSANRNLAKVSDKSFMVLFGVLYLLAIPILWVEWKTDSVPVYPIFTAISVLSIYFVVKKLNSNR